MIVDDKGLPLPVGDVVPALTERQEHEAESRTAVTALVVHETIRKNGEEELSRPIPALAWSGLAAGLSMGFSFLMQALLRNSLPDAAWRPLITNLGYPFGFLIVIIGRQQLFTENTLTAIIPLLSKRNFATFLSVLKLWAVVLTANLIGAHIFSWVMGNTSVVRSDVQEAMRQIAVAAADVSPASAVLRGIFAGWLIATVVWMLAATDSGRIPIIVILTYLVGLGRSDPCRGGVRGSVLLGRHRRQELDILSDGIFGSDAPGQHHWWSLASLFLESRPGDRGSIQNQEKPPRLKYGREAYANDRRIARRSGEEPQNPSPASIV